MQILWRDVNHLAASLTRSKAKCIPSVLQTKKTSLTVLDLTKICNADQQKGGVNPHLRKLYLQCIQEQFQRRMQNLI